MWTLVLQAPNEKQKRWDPPKQLAKLSINFRIKIEKRVGLLLRSLSLTKQSQGFGVRGAAAADGAAAAADDDDDGDDDEEDEEM